MGTVRDKLTKEIAMADASKTYGGGLLKDVMGVSFGDAMLNIDYAKAVPNIDMEAKIALLTCMKKIVDSMYPIYAYTVPGLYGLSMLLAGVLLYQAKDLSVAVSIALGLGSIGCVLSALVSKKIMSWLLGVRLLHVEQLVKTGMIRYLSLCYIAGLRIGKDEAGSDENEPTWENDVDGFSIMLASIEDRFSMIKSQCAIESGLARARTSADDDKS